MSDPEVIKLAQQSGLLFDYRNTEDFKRLIQEEDAYYMKIVKENKLGEQVLRIHDRRAGYIRPGHDFRMFQSNPGIIGL